MLHQYLETVNPYVRAYRHMSELAEDEVTAAAAEKRSAKSYRMFFTRDLNAASNVHRGRLNLPISGEIAAVFIDDDGLPPLDLDVCVYPRHMLNRHHINFLSPVCDPMCYPLFFPNGEEGKNT